MNTLTNPPSMALIEPGPALDEVLHHPPEKSDLEKTVVNVGTIGHVDHGKMALLSAISILASLPREQMDGFMVDTVNSREDDLDKRLIPRSMYRQKKKRPKVPGRV